jgi:hypothetical protein
MSLPSKLFADGTGKSEGQDLEQLQEEVLGDMMAFHDVRVLDLSIRREGAVFTVDFKQPVQSMAESQEVTAPLHAFSQKFK